MKKQLFRTALMASALLLLAGCWGTRYISADPDLEEAYLGKSYYFIVDQFGNPDATSIDRQGGTRASYSSVSLAGSVAAARLADYTVRNRYTRSTDNPEGSITFFFNADNRCYGVSSDFQRSREKTVEQPEDDGPKLYHKVKPRVPRTLDFPYVKSRSPYAKMVRIEKIEIDREKTKIYFSYCDRTPTHRPLHDKGLSINRDIYLYDHDTHRRIKFVSADGITLYPEYTPFAHNRGGYDMLVYSLTFEALPIDTETIDIVEPGAEGFNFYGVDVKTPMDEKE